MTVDIGTLDFYDKNVIEGILKRHIRQNRRLGSIMVADDEISFREFEGNLLDDQLLPISKS